MSPVSTVPSASQLQRDILRTILYFDIFRHPLRAEEIYRYLPSNSTSPGEVNSACLALPLRELLKERKGFYFLASDHRNADPVADRLAKESRARGYWRIARLVTSLIRRFPFVRAVFVSGELSKGIASRDGDIDFFIVTADRRLWIARTFLIAFKKLFFLNQKKFLCLNHFIVESSLRVETRNFYTALEVATLTPLYNGDLFLHYLRTNSWIGELLPNATSPERAQPLLKTRSSLLQNMVEVPFRGTLGDNLEDRLMHFWQRVWDRRYHNVPRERRSQMFQSTPEISTAYAGDFLSKILGEYKSRLVRFGLDEPVAGR